MALQDFGDRENDLGTFFTIGEDGETKQDIELRIRQMPDNLALKWQREHGRRKKVDGEWKTILDEENRTELGWHNLMWMWTDCRGLAVQLNDDAAVEFYRKQLGSAPFSMQTLKQKKGKADEWVREDAQDFKKGERVYLDGRLNDKIKRHVCEQYGTIARAINEANIKLQKDFGTVEDNLTLNL